MVVVLLANGFEELEALTPVDVLRRHDIDIRTVSVTNDKLVTGTHGIQVAADLTASEVPLDEIDMLILPGGMPGVKNLDATPITKIFIDATLRNGGHLAAICAAPSIFGKHGMLTNIRATCFPGFEKELYNAVVTDTDVITDGVFTTARDYESASAFAGELVKICEILGIDPNIEAKIEENKKQELPEKEAAPKDKKTVDYSSYKAPTPDLLGLDAETVTDENEIKEDADSIISVLDSFGVAATIKGVDSGPRITRYELVPAKGVKVNTITNLFDDIALNLSKEGVRMQAPIPGKSAIGIEVPKKCPMPVRLRELIESEEFASAKSKTFAAIGKDVAGNNVFADIAKYPHAIISGATGMGKSVCINSILTSILYKSRPDEVKFILIDPKKVEFTPYIDVPHLLTPVITEAKMAAAALLWAIEEMDHRYELIEKAEVRNIEAYNELAKSNGEQTLPRIIIVIDELADLMMQVRDHIEDAIMRIAQKARAAGIHLIIGTQRPSVQVITGAIKANIPTRISCKVSSQVDSRTIFDMAGAEKLLSRGDMLYWPVGQSSPSRVQGAFVSDGEVESVARFIKEQYPDADYDCGVEERIKELAANIGPKFPNEDDEESGLLFDQTFLEAVEVAIHSGKVSTSLLQRKLSIGYGKAAKYIDAMEELGFISSFNGQKPRSVLITLEEWKSMLKKINL